MSQGGSNNPSGTLRPGIQLRAISYTGGRVIRYYDYPGLASTPPAAVQSQDNHPPAYQHQINGSNVGATAQSVSSNATTRPVGDVTHSPAPPPGPSLDVRDGIGGAANRGSSLQGPLPSNVPASINSLFYSSPIPHPWPPFLPPPQLPPPQQGRLTTPVTYRYRPSTASPPESRPTQETSPNLNASSAVPVTSIHPNLAPPPVPWSRQEVAPTTLPPHRNAFSSLIAWDELLQSQRRPNDTLPTYDEAVEQGAQPPSNTTPDYYTGTQPGAHGPSNPHPVPQGESPESSRRNPTRSVAVVGNSVSGQTNGTATGAGRLPSQSQPVRDSASDSHSESVSEQQHASPSASSSSSSSSNASATQPAAYVAYTPMFPAGPAIWPAGTTGFTNTAFGIQAGAPFVHYAPPGVLQAPWNPYASLQNFPRPNGDASLEARENNIRRYVMNGMFHPPPHRNEPLPWYGRPGPASPHGAGNHDSNNNN
ncbi:hypothetical protein L228DRAFT_237199 [Xylona heveae TC161]|uniref:Uncharacterized protein n=1 Tax=Xylona heveae (strain CBS 132557 / TC161) TaxID=1328760 RepID=A0A165I235_XYLHT|nr:hypothetical protein L228DRAFT_237199 [Xylona heveae TC161]KZF24252.1 hypothetical protein L228DRAFT_237199 [Xylona heveae TC161]